jgi:Fe-only nitrogenase delta subunit
MQDTLTDRREELINYIMKHCLWQFHSRAWDRERQNREILRYTREYLCGEADQPPAELLERCHWTDGVSLARAFRENFPWLNELDKNEVGELMNAVHERMDFLLIKGSLNLELTDEHY